MRQWVADTVAVAVIAVAVGIAVTVGALEPQVETAMDLVARPVPGDAARMMAEMEDLKQRAEQQPAGECDYVCRPRPTASR